MSSHSNSVESKYMHFKWPNLSPICLSLQECELNYNNIWRTRSWWSRKCLWPGPRYTFGFKYAAFAAAQKYLDKAQAEPRKGGQDMGVVLSPATRNKVIQSWVDHDLARFANTVLFNFSLLSAALVIIITSIAWLWGRFGVGREAKSGGSTYSEKSVFKKDGFFPRAHDSRYQ